MISSVILVGFAGGLPGGSATGGLSTAELREG